MGPGGISYTSAELQGRAKQSIRAISVVTPLRQGGYLMDEFDPQSIYQTLLMGMQNRDTRNLSLSYIKVPVGHPLRLAETAPEVTPKAEGSTLAWFPGHDSGCTLL